MIAPDTGFSFFFFSLSPPPSALPRWLLFNKLFPSGSRWKWIVFVHASEMNNPTFERSPITESVFTLKLLSTRRPLFAPLSDDYAALNPAAKFISAGERAFVADIEWKICRAFFQQPILTLWKIICVLSFEICSSIGTYRKAFILLALRILIFFLHWCLPNFYFLFTLISFEFRFSFFTLTELVRDRV